MLSSYKKGLLFITAILLFAVTKVFAQYGQYTPAMNAMFSQQFMQSMQRQSMMNMMNHMNTGQYNKKYDFVVNMKDGSTQEVSSKILVDTSSKKSYLLLVNRKLKKSDINREQKIYVDQTTSIIRKTFSDAITGISKDTCWMFKAVSGPISAYSFYSEDSDSFNFTEYSLVGLQFNDGPIIKLNEENLVAMIGSNDPDILKKIKKKDYYSVIKKYNKEALKKAAGK